MPEVEETCKKADQEHLYQEILDKYIKNDPHHAWFIEGFDPQKVEDLKKYYKDRYGQKAD